MNDYELRDIAMILAGYYACQCEEMGGKFEEFGADAIKHCYEYRDIIKSLTVSHTENGYVDTECFRDEIYEAIFTKYLGKRDEVPWVKIQEQTVAHWEKYDDDLDEYYCSNCEWPAGLDAYGFHRQQDLYCHHCGAKMNIN